MDAGLTKRLTVSTIATTLVLGAISELAGSATQFAAKESGFDRISYQYVLGLMRVLAPVTTSAPFLFLTVLFVGAATYSWADYIFRKWVSWYAPLEGSIAIKLRLINRELLAMTLILLFGFGLVLSAAWYFYEKRGNVSSPIDDQLLSSLRNELDQVKNQRDNAFRETERLKKQLETNSIMPSVAPSTVLDPFGRRPAKDPYQPGSPLVRMTLTRLQATDLLNSLDKLKRVTAVISTQLPTDIFPPEPGIRPLRRAPFWFDKLKTDGVDASIEKLRSVKNNFTNITNEINNM